MSTVDPNLFKTMVETAPEAVALCEATSGHWHVTYVNPAMEHLTGYKADAMLGRNLRFLQAEDHDQEGLDRIREALRDGNSCRATLRNYRSDGTQFWNEVVLAPLRSPEGQITHYASFHREAGVTRTEARPEARDPSMNTQTMLAYLRDDKLTGLLRRPYFEELIKRDWGLAQRESRRLSFLVFDLDNYSHYRDVFGRQGSDQSFRRVARVVGGCFRRASDLCGRFDEDQIAALTTGLDLSQASKLAEAVLARVRDLAIHHPRSSVSRYVTASAGVVSLVPPHDAPPNKIYQAAIKALKDAKDLGRNRVVSRECE
ncbi:diguanylate cyclase (GGDEF)-like protein/PAS domain S-box-containing protein [Povalibacter uvarum]|uniref:Diguanylate cyclase (GGDEF)-like protein/PAS domain S-box-containing protein n=1 Tax=Povalibacter uvarum TaxID=732238 RepID=A0A841HFB9_9GAMM|nr:GGDEF domain-containing protein [Povalibacter uvarum]MBB6091811.1 diguanylate cyclase (GGDEF)-like protein/PAS domain S-box-containing protein [Povalibacter uvarum]